jgi:Cu-processing system permease protein
MDFNAVFEIARQELMVTIRNRWTMIFAVVFGILVVSISYFGMRAEGFSQMQSFTRTSASILNLVLYIVPLVALTMGTLSLTSERGSTELLFSQPVFRSEVILGKWLGLFFSIALSTLAGFSSAAGVILVNAGSEGLSRYVSFVALSLGLALCFLSMAVLIAVMSRRKPKAFGYVSFLWFFFVLLYDLLAIGGSLMLHGQSSSVFLLVSVFGNPVDMVRVASLMILDDSTLFGSACAALLRFLGGQTLSLTLLACALVLWSILPLLFSMKLIGRHDL